jgi:type II secretory pathway pseudopilin PulG
MTLVEVMLAIVIIAIAVIGASGYRYYSALDARKASVQSTAARIALLFNENWRGLGYDRIADFDPHTHLVPDVNVANSAFGPDFAEGFISLGKYEIIANDARFWAALSWRQEVDDLRTINTVIAWQPGGAGVGESGKINLYKSFKLTTFVAD